MMDKFAGRFYVSSLILLALADVVKKIAESQNYLLLIIACIHLVCLFFVVKDGVK